MEILTPKNSDVKDIVGDFGSTSASISDASLPFLFRMLSNGLYSNPIGSICREITSNCFDAHIEANIDEPVIISRGNDAEGNYILFKDSGIGMSRFRMLKIYMKYFSSTKRKTNSLIGGFGLGSKTPLSYTDSFYITTIKNGMRYEYLYSKGEELPTLDCLTGHIKKTISGGIYHKIVDGDKLPVIPAWEVNWPEGESTKQTNGTEIKIYFKWEDKGQFKDELKAQLCYFDNVYFSGWDIDNDYKIYDDNLFKFRNKNPYSDEMHICFGKVSYPIDWDQINLESYKIPVGIKFNIGELQPTPNREAFRYTDEAKELIRTRVLQTVELLTKLYQEQNKPIYNYIDWWLKKDSTPYITFGDNDRLKLTGIKTVNKSYKFEPFKNLDLYYDDDDFISLLYEKVRLIENGTEVKFRYVGISDLSIKNRYKVAVGNYDISGVKNAYFNYGMILKRQLSKEFKPKFKREVITIWNEKSKKGIAGYDTYGRPIYGSFGDGRSYFELGLAKKIYKINKRLRRIFEFNSINYNLIPQSFIDEYKARKRANDYAYQRKINNKVHVRSIRTNVSNDISIRQIELYTGIIVYGNREDKEALKDAVIFLNKVIRNTEPRKKEKYKSRKPQLFGKDSKGITLVEKRCVKVRHKIPIHKNYAVLLISKQAEEHFNKPNMIHVKNLYSDHELFRKVASGFKLQNFIKSILKNQSTYNLKEYLSQIGKINSDISITIQKIVDYIRKNLSESNHSANSRIEEAILSIAEENGWFDQEAEDLLTIVEAFYKDVEILKYVDLNEDSLPNVLKTLRKAGKKINYEYYLKYNPPCKPEKDRDRYGQIIIMFPEKEEEDNAPVSKFRALTERTA